MSTTHALIIDDNAQNIEVLARLLASHDITHTAVQDSNKLETTLDTEERIDIVFLDLEMPSRDGYQLFGVLRKSLNPQIPIIACTVHYSEVAQARKLGFDGFITKPLSPALFAEQLNQIMQGEPVWEDK